MGCAASGHRCFSDDYVLGRKLATGTFTQTRMCTERRTGEERAVKIRSQPYSEADCRFEVELLSELNFAGRVPRFARSQTASRSFRPPDGVDAEQSVRGIAHILRFFGAYCEKAFFCEVFELCEGGELMALDPTEEVTEAVVRQWIRQLLLAVEALHVRSIVHRNVNPTSVLLREESRKTVKLGGFGLACRISRGELLKEACGSSSYLAPEMLIGNYGRKVDVWAVGVILYVFLFGRLPFVARDTFHLFKSIIEDEPRWTYTSTRELLACHRFSSCDSFSSETLLRATSGTFRGSCKTDISEGGEGGEGGAGGAGGTGGTGGTGEQRRDSHFLRPPVPSFEHAPVSATAPSQLAHEALEGRSPSKREEDAKAEGLSDGNAESACGDAEAASGDAEAASLQPNEAAGGGGEGGAGSAPPSPKVGEARERDGGRAGSRDAPEPQAKARQGWWQAGDDDDDYAPNPLAVELCKLLLTKNFLSRPTATEALTHPWLREENWADGNPGRTLPNSLCRRIAMCNSEQYLREGSMQSFNVGAESMESTFDAESVYRRPPAGFSPPAPSVLGERMPLTGKLAMFQSPADGAAARLRGASAASSRLEPSATTQTSLGGGAGGGETSYKAYLAAGTLLQSASFAEKARDPGDDSDPALGVAAPGARGETAEGRGLGRAEPAEFSGAARPLGSPARPARFTPKRSNLTDAAAKASPSSAGRRDNENGRRAEGGGGGVGEEGDDEAAPAAGAAAGGLRRNRTGEPRRTATGRSSVVRSAAVGDGAFEPGGRGNTLASAFMRAKTKTPAPRQRLQENAYGAYQADVVRVRIS